MRQYRPTGITVKCFFIIIIITTLPAPLVSDKEQLGAAFFAQDLRTPPHACSPVLRCAFCSQYNEQLFKNMAMSGRDDNKS